MWPQLLSRTMAIFAFKHEQTCNAWLVKYIHCNLLPWFWDSIYEQNLPMTVLKPSCLLYTYIHLWSSMTDIQIWLSIPGLNTKARPTDSVYRKSFVLASKHCTMVARLVGLKFHSMSHSSKLSVILLYNRTNNQKLRVQKYMKIQLSVSLLDAFYNA